MFNLRYTLRVNLPENGDLLVAMFAKGDILHGQLKDALWILQTQGPPGPDTAYIFNGDIADRGEDAVEIFATVFRAGQNEPTTMSDR